MPTAAADVSAPSPLDRGHATLDEWRESNRAERETNVANAKRLVLTALRVEAEVAIELDAALQHSAGTPTDADREHTESRIRARVLARLHTASPDLAAQLDDESALAAAIEATGAGRARQAELKQAIAECLALHRLHAQRDRLEKEYAEANTLFGRHRQDAEQERRRRGRVAGAAQARVNEVLAVPERLRELAAANPELRWEGDPPRPSSGLFD